MSQLVYAEKPESVLILLPDILTEQPCSPSRSPLFVRPLQPSTHYGIQIQTIFSSYSSEFATCR